MSEDFYETLGVSRDASEDEIKQAYREKAREYHPDVSDDPNADEKFKQVKKAKEVLSDEDERAAYDRLGHDRYTQAAKQGFDPGGNGGAGGFGGGGFNGGGFGDINDIFETFFGGGGGRGRNQPRRGQDLAMAVTVSMEEAFHGTEISEEVTRPIRCPECEGKGHPADADVSTCETCGGSGQQTTVRQTPLGRVQQSRTCPDCEGEGQQYSETCARCDGDGVARERETISFDIDAGVRDGHRLTVKGEGAPGPNGGPNGDLIIEVTVEAHDEFERDGDDLYYRLPLSFPQVVFGTEVEVPHFDGPITVEVPAGTQSGETLREKNAGMPHFRSPGQGDLYVQVQVVTPNDLTEEQREALTAFAEAGGEEVEIKQGFFEKLKNSF